MFEKNRLEKETEQALANKGVYRILLTRLNHFDDETRKFLEGLNFRYSKRIKRWHGQTLYNLSMPDWNKQFQKDIDEIKKYQSRKGDLGVRIMTDHEFEDIKTDIGLLKSLELKEESPLDRLKNYIKTYFKT